MLRCCVLLRTDATLCRVQAAPQPVQQDVPTLPRFAPLETIHSAKKRYPEPREPLPSGGGVYQPPPSLSAADVFPFATAQKAAAACNQLAPSQLPARMRAAER